MKSLKIAILGLLVALFIAGPVYALVFCNGVSSTSGQGGCGTPIAIGVATAIQVIPYGVSTASAPNLNETWSVQLRSGGPMNCAPGVVGGGTPSSTPSATASGGGFQFNANQLYTQTNAPTSLQQSNAFLGLWCVCQTGTCLVDGQWETGQ